MEFPPVVHKYPQWQEPLAAAILEFDTQQLRQKLQNAHGAIAKRLQEVASDNQDELRALNDGLFLLRGVEDRLQTRSVHFEDD